MQQLNNSHLICFNHVLKNHDFPFTIYLSLDEKWCLYWIMIFSRLTSRVYLFCLRQSSFLGRISSVFGTGWESRAWSRKAHVHCKWLIGYQTSREEKKVSSPCLIHFSQPANEVGTVGAINYRWEKVGWKEREKDEGEERGLPRMRQSFSTSLNITVVFCNLHAHSCSGNGVWRPRTAQRTLGRKSFNVHEPQTLNQ